ncbi:MAG: hypothetical protein KGI00_03830 [Candidatus Micrarchaeota archaeon]|nr:hypothetical protein [Candidatus Micrarchaeota archaeon]MDE1849830.1 hypothetical protein [Candidatus Micrarchaeota archaeon]
MENIKRTLSEAQVELKKSIDRITKIIEAKVKPSKKGYAISFIRRDRVTH